MLWTEAALFTVLLAVTALWGQWSGEHFLPYAPELFYWADGLTVQSVIWVLPALLYLRCRRPPIRWQLEELVRSPFPLRDALMVACLFACAQNTIRLLVHADAVVYAPFRTVFIPVIIGAGVTEEFFFRGFLFNRMMAVWPAWAAVLGSSVCFLLYHYPELFIGMTVTELLCARSLLLLTMGTVFALLLKRTRNLPVCMLLHGFWNLLSYLFVLYV